MNTTDWVSTSIAIGEPNLDQTGSADQLYAGKGGGNARPEDPGIAVGEPFPSTGTSGDDQLYAGKGASTVDGGRGNDTALLMGGYTDYVVTHDAVTGDVILVNLNAGNHVSRLVSIEQLRFSDLTVNAADADTGASVRHAATMGDDTLVGNDWGYVLQGHDGNDSFTGNGGDDTLYGGKGDDVAVFRGVLSDYTIEHEAWSGAYRVIDKVKGRDGTDVTWGIEQLRFADQTVDPGAVAVELAPPEYPLLWVMDGELAVIETLNTVTLTVTSVGDDGVALEAGSALFALPADAGMVLVGMPHLTDPFNVDLP